MFSAQVENTIHCYAPHFKGQIARLYTYEDYISYELKELDQGYIDSTGLVVFKTKIKRGTKASIHIQDKAGIIYLDPATEDYYVSFPKEQDYVQKLNGNTVRLVFDDLSNNDLNMLIMDFNIRFDYFLYGDSIKMQRLLARGTEFQDSLTDFAKTIFKNYEGVNNRYFKNHVKYNIAKIALFSNRKEPEINKLKVFESFIKAQPILYHNEAYMVFIKDFYKDLLSDISIIDRDKATTAVNTLVSVNRLHEVMAMHYYLRNVTFRELIMLNSLDEAYYSSFYNRENVQLFLKTIANNGSDEKHRTIAKNILKLQNKMKVGNKAPNFSWIDNKGVTKELKNFEGKYVYLSFWASWNKPSVRDQMMLAQMKEKYEKYIKFISISLDANQKDFEIFMYKNRKVKFNWEFGHYNGDSKILLDYNLRSVPSYFLITPDGYLQQSPAMSPSPNGSLKSIDETFFSIKKKLEPKNTFQIGGKSN